MKIEKPKSLSEFLELFRIYTNNGNDYYRGQSDCSWEITPSLARNKSIRNIDILISLERKLIENFKKKIKDNNLGSLIPYVEGSYDKSWILLMAAQHYGLPTRLLDFSNDKFTALEFAVADIQNLNKDGALIIYEGIESIQENVGSAILRSPFSQTHNTFFFQGISFGVSKNNEFNLAERRKRIQGSKFLYRDTPNLCECLSSDKLHSERLTKICIPREFKLDIIKYLMKVERMAYDLFAGKNELDYYAAILKLEFSKLYESKIEEYIKSD